ncbi:MAG: hypothetical protein OEW49_04410 [Nitrosopumilus sp.]|nr:hypothetical protein [Nitrosopumilus sp.]
METKQAGETLIVINVISHYIKKTVKANRLIVNVMQSMSRYGLRERLQLANDSEKI